MLDGSADWEPDARLYEWGLERESATDWHFQFINPGVGALNLDVDGTVAATGLHCPDCVTSAEIANLSITGADLAGDSVTGAKIADGTVGLRRSGERCGDQPQDRRRSGGCERDPPRGGGQHPPRRRVTNAKIAAER